jgi:hypothetical protein
MTKIHSLQNSLAIYPNQDLSTVLNQFNEVLNEFDNLDFLVKRSNVRNLLFCIDRIVKNNQIDISTLENLAKTAKKLKQFTYQSDFYSKVNTALYKKMFLLSGDSKRETLFKKNYNVDIETGLILITSQNIEIFESLEDSFLRSFSDKLIFVETGYDGLTKVEIELINMNYPFLCLADYKKEILNSSDLLTVDFDSKVFINDGAEQNHKNILELEPGKYDCVCYEFESKYKIVIVKPKCKD